MFHYTSGQCFAEDFDKRSIESVKKTNNSAIKGCGDGCGLKIGRPITLINTKLSSSVKQQGILKSQIANTALFKRAQFSSKRFFVVVTINPNGSIVDLRIEISSGSQETDKLATDCIRAAAPFKTISSKSNSYRIEFPSLNINTLTTTTNSKEGNFTINVK